MRITELFFETRIKFCRTFDNILLKICFVLFDSNFYCEVKC